MESKNYQSLCSPSNEVRRRRLADNEVSLKFRTNKDYMITFSTKMSAIIKRHGLGLMDVRMDDLTEEIDLVLSNEHGLAVSWSGHNGQNCNLCNKGAIMGIYKALGLTEGENHIVKISKNLSKKDGFLVFRLIHQPADNLNRFLFQP